MCKKLGIRYIFPSSCSLYGIGEVALDEESPTNPQTPYSLNKLQIEQDLAALADKTFSPIALRLATVFGISPRIRFDVVINMLCGMAVAQKQVVLNSDGQAWRPHLEIQDACEAFRCCIEWNYQDGKLMVLNVGRNDNNWKILDVARLIKSKVNGC
jgi:nucleoside-diphosphate-sugar epimerase